jgi:anti-sigma B factor antagonist
VCLPDLSLLGGGRNEGWLAEEVSSAGFRVRRAGRPSKVDLTLRTNLDGDSVVVSAAGEVDLATVEALRRELDSALRTSGCRRVIADLTDVDFMDSTGLGVLVGARRRMHKAEVEMCLVVPRAPLLKLFRMTNLDRVFPIYPSLNAALGDARPAQAGPEAAV